LGRIAHAGAVESLVELLAVNDDKDVYLRHGASLALARIGNADALKALSTHSSRAVRLGAVVALRRMRNAAVAEFLNDKDEYVVTEAARAINDDLSIEGALPALGKTLNTTPFRNEPLIRRAINANLRVGTDEGVQALIAYASGQNNPELMRAEALAALSTWAKPSVLDRVDGRYRGEVKRNAENLTGVAAAPIAKLASDKSALVRLESVKAIGKLKFTSGSATLLAKLKSDPDPGVREEALKSLAAIEDKGISDAIQMALRDKGKNVRVTALDLLPKLGLDNALMVSLLSEVINTKTVEEKQAALTTLGNIPVDQSKKVFDQLLTKYQNKQFPVEATLELSDAIDKTGSKELRDRYREINAKSSTDTLKAAYAGALFGGNIDRGARIFYANQSAQCIRCHSYGDYGGNAGPRLNGVATRLSREQLLEALVNPSARLAPGYGMVTLELKDGRKVSGILAEEKADFLKVKVGSKPDTVIQAANVAKKTYAASSMPPMRTLLTKKEIRDVISFLATMKEE
jgi:putative heme-binding domain-containing protein